MAGSVTGLHVFAADVGPEPLSLLDGNFNPLATAINTLSTFSNYYVDSGAVNALAITVNAPQVVSAYTDGLMVQVQVANTTTSATPTLAINGLGARTLIHSDGSALAIGELVAAMRFTAIYDATNAEFRILSPTFTAVTLNAPTFNATVTINAVAGKPSLEVNVAPNQYAAEFFAGTNTASQRVLHIKGSSAAGFSGGLFIEAGTNGSDDAVYIRSQSAATNFALIRGDGSGYLGWNGSAQTITFAAAGNVVITTPSSGIAAVVNGVAGAQALQVKPGSSASVGLEIVDPGANATTARFNTTNSAVIWQSAGGSAAMQINGGNSLSLNSGPVTVVAPSSGTALTVNAAANAYGVIIVGSSTSGQSDGLTVQAGTTSADVALNVENQAASASFLQISGDGHGFLGPSSTLGLSWNTAGNLSVATPTSGTPLTINGTSGAGAYIKGTLTTNANCTSDFINLSAGTAAQVQIRLQNATHNFNFGLSSTAFSGSAFTNAPAGELAFLITNAAVPITLGTNATAAFNITTAQALQGWGPTAAAFVDMTPDSGSWSTTLSGGFTSNPSGTLNWRRMGNFVEIYCTAAITGTSNAATDITASGLPAAITPAANRFCCANGVTNNNSASFWGAITVNSGGTLLIQLVGANPTIVGTNSAAFTNANSKGISAGFSITYSL